MLKRNLDGVYFREKNEDDKWDNICFSDMTEDQMRRQMKGRSEEWLKSMCIILAKALREIGDQFDIVAE